MIGEHLEKAKNWFEHVNRSYKIALAVIIVLSVGATVYWSYIHKQWSSQMFTDVYNRYKCVFSGLTTAVTSCIGETLPGASAPAPAVPAVAPPAAVPVATA